MITQQLHFYCRLVKMASFAISGAYYSMSSEQRAKKVTQMTQISTIDFCKDFWNVAEYPLLQQVIESCALIFYCLK